MTQKINYSSSTPAAGTGRRLCSWQADAPSSDPAISRNISVSYDNWGGLNAQTGTTYTLAASDRGKLITFSNASAIALTLPNANTLDDHFVCVLKNMGSTNVTITPTTSTLDGAASLILYPGQGLILFGNHANYFSNRGRSTETEIALIDVTTWDVSTSRHGFAPKLPNDNTKYLDGSGAWSTPSGGGSSTPIPVGIADNFWYFAADLENISNNALLQKWADKYHLVSATQAAGATYLTSQINSKPALSFPAGSNGRYAVSPSLLFREGFTAFLVFKMNSLTPATGFVFFGGVSGAADLRINSSGKLLLVKAFTANIGADTTTLSTGTWYQMNVKYDLTNWAFRVNRAAGASGTTANTFTAGTSAIGWSPADSGLDLNGYIAEIILYDRALGSTEITTVETYLNTKYGV
jgi:hypothetical protein